MLVYRIGKETMTIDNDIVTYKNDDEAYIELVELLDVEDIAVRLGVKRDSMRVTQEYDGTLILAGSPIQCRWLFMQFICSGTALRLDEDFVSNHKSDVSTDKMVKHMKDFAFMPKMNSQEEDFKYRDFIEGCRSVGVKKLRDIYTTYKEICTHKRVPALTLDNFKAKLSCEGILLQVDVVLGDYVLVEESVTMMEEEFVI